MIQLQHIRQSLLSKDIPRWRKRAVFLVQVLAISFGIVHFGVYFDFAAAPRQLCISFSAMVAIGAAVQLIASWFVLRHNVPAYLWVGCSVWVIVTLFWQGLTVVLWSVA